MDGDRYLKLLSNLVIDLGKLSDKFMAQGKKNSCRVVRMCVDIIQKYYWTEYDNLYPKGVK